MGLKIDSLLGSIEYRQKMAIKSSNSKKRKFWRIYNIQQRMFSMKRSLFNMYRKIGKIY